MIVQATLVGTRHTLLVLSILLGLGLHMIYNTIVRSCTHCQTNSKANSTKAPLSVTEKLLKHLKDFLLTQSDLVYIQNKIIMLTFLQLYS